MQCIVYFPASGRFSTISHPLLLYCQPVMYLCISRACIFSVLYTALQANLTFRIPPGRYCQLWDALLGWRRPHKLCIHTTTTNHHTIVHCIVDSALALDVQCVSHMTTTTIERRLPQWIEVPCCEIKLNQDLTKCFPSKARISFCPVALQSAIEYTTIQIYNVCVCPL